MEQDKSEATLLDLLTLIWGKRLLAACLTIAITMLGTGYGFLIQPVYRSEALIAPKEVQAGGNASALLAQMGGMGGIMASHLGLGKADLNRLEVIFKSREVAESVIVENQLLPRLFPKKWDEIKSKWKEKPPSIRDGVELLKRSALSVDVVAKKNILIIGISLHDSTLAKTVVGYFLNEVNLKIKRDARQEAETNRRFLMEQMVEIGDPLLREKVQQLMANEIEKSMLISSNSFDLLEKPVVPIERERPNRKLIMIFSAFLGLSLSAVWIIAANAFGKNKRPALST